MEVYIDDEAKLTLHGLQQHYVKLKVGLKASEVYGKKIGTYGESIRVYKVYKVIDFLLHPHPIFQLDLLFHSPSLPNLLLSLPLPFVFLLHSLLFPFPSLSSPFPSSRFPSFPPFFPSLFLSSPPLSHPPPFLFIHPVNWRKEKEEYIYNLWNSFCIFHFIFVHIFILSIPKQKNVMFWIG